METVLTTAVAACRLVHRMAEAPEKARDECASLLGRLLQLGASTAEAAPLRGRQTTRLVNAAKYCFYVSELIRDDIDQTNYEDWSWEQGQAEDIAGEISTVGIFLMEKR